MTLFDHALQRTSPIHFYHADDQIETSPAQDFVARAGAIAAQMRSLGVAAGDTVVLLMPTCVELIACVIAAWGCRAAVCIAPHTIGDDAGRLSGRKLAAILDLLQPKLLVHEPALGAKIDDARAARTTGTIRLCRDQLATADVGGAFPSAPLASDVAIIQLTSGSTSLPKGVPLRHDQMDANVAGLLDRVAITGADHLVSWLPLYHDMGLSALTMMLMADATLTLIVTERFVRAPGCWLQALSRQRATLSLAPAFAYQLMAKAARRYKPGEIDISTWRYTWIGAEPIFAENLQSFERALAPFGLRRGVIQPAYGLAEAVVAVSCNQPATPYRVLALDGSRLREYGHVRVVDANEPGAITLVANGRPIAGAEVCIRQPDGSPADPDQQGHVWIAGPFVAQSYLGGVEPERFKDGWYDTGDLGFMHDGEVYISGRAKDVIIRGGVNTSPAQVEWVIEQTLGLRAAKVVVFSRRDLGRAREEVIAVVGMRPAPEERAALIRRLSAEVAQAVGLMIDQVVFTAAANIPKTTSGKVQRALAREMYGRGQFDTPVEPADERLTEETV